MNSELITRKPPRPRSSSGSSDQRSRRSSLLITHEDGTMEESDCTVTNLGLFSHASGSEPLTIMEIGHQHDETICKLDKGPDSHRKQQPVNTTTVDIHKEPMMKQLKKHEKEKEPTTTTSVRQPSPPGMEASQPMYYNEAGCRENQTSSFGHNSEQERQVGSRNMVVVKEGCTNNKILTKKVNPAEDLNVKEDNLANNKLAMDVKGNEPPSPKVSFKLVIQQIDRY